MHGNEKFLFVNLKNFHLYIEKYYSEIVLLSIFMFTTWDANCLPSAFCDILLSQSNLNVPFLAVVIGKYANFYMHLNILCSISIR